MWYLFALISGFCAAILAIIIKIHLKHLNPFFITFLFSIITFMVFLGGDMVTKKIHCSLITSLTTKEWVALIIAGCLNALAFTAYLAALEMGKASSVVAIDRAGILFVVILSIIFLQEPCTPVTIGGALLMIIGTALLCV